MATPTRYYHLVLTDWFPPEVKPVRPGPYELENLIAEGRAYSTGAVERLFAYWDGKRWQGHHFSFAMPTKNNAEMIGDVLATVHHVASDFARRNDPDCSWCHSRRWRGLDLNHFFLD